MRDKAEKRHNDWKKAIRKRRIDRETQGTFEFQHDWYDNLHQYSKNKIHYSYGRYHKTNNKGKHRYAPKNYAKSKNWSPSDQRKLDTMDDKI